MSEVTARQWREAANVLRQQAIKFDHRAEEVESWRVRSEAAEAELAELRATVGDAARDLRIVAKSHGRGPSWLQREASRLAAALAAAPSGEPNTEEKR